MAELAIEHVHRGLVGEARVRRAQHVERIDHRRERVAQLVREDREELVLAAVARAQRRGALLDAALELLVHALETAALAVQVREHRHFRAQDFRHHRHAHVVHRARVVALEAMHVVHEHGGDQDDRGVPVARVAADHRRELEAVELRHADVDQHHRDVGPQQLLERFARRAGADQRRVEVGEHRFVREQLPRLVVDEQDLNGFVLTHAFPD